MMTTTGAPSFFPMMLSEKNEPFVTNRNINILHHRLTIPYTNHDDVVCYATIGLS